jgi:hypothetical protein
MTSKLKKEAKKHLFLLLFTASLSSYDDVHRYRPIYFFGEPHLSRDGLSNVYLSCAHGKSRKGIGRQHTTTALFDIYGTHNIRTAAQSVPSSCLTSPIGVILQELRATSGSPCYAHLSCNGLLEITETVLRGYQNFTHGVFAAWYVPWRSLHVQPRACVDLTPPSEMTPAWQAFLDEGERAFTLFGLSQNAYVRHGVGDTACSLGYAYTYDRTCWLDFLDVSMQFGIVFPTSARDHNGHFFEIPLGYEGHAGYFGMVDLSAGWFDWITAGVHVQCLGFLRHNNMQRVKTSSMQEGLYLLTKSCMREQKGGIYTGGAYLKADHVLLGFSCVFGYSIAAQTQSSWSYVDTHEPYLFPDQRLSSWTMHSIHLQLDYDCATHNNPNAPRVGFIYNTAFRGSRIIETSMTGGFWEITITWNLS